MDVFPAVASPPKSSDSRKCACARRLHLLFTFVTITAFSKANIGFDGDEVSVHNTEGHDKEMFLVTLIVELTL